jgi:hypothetical protein
VSAANDALLPTQVLGAADSSEILQVLPRDISALFGVLKC